MNLNNFTIKAQEAIQQAFQVALGLNHQSVETAHILKGVMTEAESVSNQLLKKCGVNTPIFSQTVDRIIESFPKVTGGSQYLSQDGNRVLQKASEAWVLE